LKKLLFISLCLLLGCSVWAAQLVRPVSMSGTYYTVIDPVGADNVYVFSSLDDASFETISGNGATWTELKTGDKVEGMTTFLSVQDGYCYRVEEDTLSETFVFIDYSKHRILDANPKVTLTCHETTINMGEYASITYYTDSLNTFTDQYDVTNSIPQQISVEYQNQVWKETEWVNQDTSFVLTDMVTHLDSILCDTRFKFTETELSSYLTGTSDSILIDTLHAVAVAHHKMHYITKRGKSMENEKEGPYEDQTIIQSAPLDVLFESHPSDKVDAYTWKISRGKDTIVTRHDKDIRYYFDEASESGPVMYYAHLTLTNTDEDCTCITTAKDTITLNSSFILVPNVFTPNGDGVNDEFRVAYRSICEFHCWVYNRWQHLVYSWDDPSKGWDGTTGGRKQPDSAFLYIIEARGCDGQKFKLKGMVNMLRGE